MVTKQQESEAEFTWWPMVKELMTHQDWHWTRDHLLQYMRATQEQDLPPVTHLSDTSDMLAQTNSVSRSAAAPLS